MSIFMIIYSYYGVSRGEDTRSSFWLITSDWSHLIDHFWLISSDWSHLIDLSVWLAALCPMGEGGTVWTLRRSEGHVVVTPGDPYRGLAPPPSPSVWVGERTEGPPVEMSTGGPSAAGPPGGPHLLSGDSVLCWLRRCGGMGAVDRLLTGPERNQSTVTL